MNRIPHIRVRNIAYIKGIGHGKGTDPTFHFDADPNPVPDPDPIPSFTHVGKSENLLTFVPISATLVVLWFRWFHIRLTNIFNLTKIFVIGLHCLVKVAQHIAVHLYSYSVCKKRLATFPSPAGMSLT
jgi:hypothetical protein